MTHTHTHTHTHTYTRTHARTQSLGDTLKELMVEVYSLASSNPFYTDPTSGVKIKLLYIWGGDMKYLLMIYGLCSATSNHPCLFCIVSKANFYKGKI